MAAGAWIGGALYDVFGYYTPAFVAAIIANLCNLAIVLLLLLRVYEGHYMPVTRDLSQGKRETILKWLARIEQDGAFMALVKAAVAVAPPAIKMAQLTRVADVEPEGGKTTFARSLARSRANTRRAGP